MLLLLLHACGPSQPAPAPAGTPSSASLAHIESIQGLAEELIEVGEALDALEDELRSEARDPELIRAEMATLVERADALTEAIDAELLQAEGGLRARPDRE